MLPSERNLKLFSSMRLFPSVAYHRPVIEALLAQTAATDPVRYEQYLEKYNALAEAQGVLRFGKVIIVKEEVAPPKVKKPKEEKVEVKSEPVKITITAEEEPVTEKMKVTIPVKKAKKSPKFI